MLPNAHPTSPPSPGSARSDRAERRHPSRPKRVGLIAGAAIVAVLLTGCEWALFNGSDGPVGRRTCQVQEENMVHVDTSGFNGGQIADIQAAVAWLADTSGVPLRYVEAPGENWLPSSTNHILIERHPVIDPNGHQRGSYSKPVDRNNDGWYDAGILRIDPSQDVQPTGRRWGDGGSNFFKLVVHELSHQLGVADISDQNELMGSISLNEPGWGDRLAWDAVGC